MSDPEVRAAGGLVVRDRGDGPEFAVVHRPRYDDWSLPKGKLDRGEGWEQAALREVEEETGLHCELGRRARAGALPRPQGAHEGGPLVADEPARTATSGPHDEVDELRWVTPAEADGLLDYEHDRDLVRSALGTPDA